MDMEKIKAAFIEETRKNLLIYSSWIEEENATNLGMPLSINPKAPKTISSFNGVEEDDPYVLRINCFFKYVEVLNKNLEKVLARLDFDVKDKKNKTAYKEISLYLKATFVMLANEYTDKVFDE